MPGVQCVICLSSDTSAEEWSVLRECGHVFHTHCLAQSLEHNRRCPQCRVEYSRRKFGNNNRPYQKIFFEFSEEPFSQPVPNADTIGTGSVDLQQTAFLQGQLRDKDRRIQTLSTQLTEVQDQAEQLEQQLTLARTWVREKEVKLQEKIQELSREHKQVKGLANQVANLTLQLKGETARASLLALASDHTLAGGALAMEVDKLVQLGLKAPNDFWEKLVSERSQVIMSNSNKHAREKAALERRQQQLQMELDKLQEQVATLQKRLVAHREQQPGDVAATDADICRDSRLSNAAAGPASRHANSKRRFGANAASLAGLPAAVAAAEEEDPLIHSYDVLNMRQADIAAASRRQHVPPQQQEQRQAAIAIGCGGEDEEEDGMVVLNGSEEQVEEIDCFSEIESDVEDEQRQQQAGASDPACQQQQQQGQPSNRTVLGKRQAADSTVPQAWPRQQLPLRSSIGSGGQASMPDENYSSGGSRGAPLMAAAGPGRSSLQHAPGKSFIRNVATASLGIDRGKYITSGPDGKGGVAMAYQGGPGGASMRLSQQQIDVRTLQQAGSSKRARSGMGGCNNTAARPITSFFSKATQQ